MMTRRNMMRTTAAVAASTFLVGGKAGAQSADKAIGPNARKPAPMIKMIITIKRREGMTHEEFVKYQRETHRPLLLSIPEAKQYIRRFVVSYPIPAPDYSSPDYDSVVEAWFDTMEDMNALYASENFLKKVGPDHKNFMDLSAYGRIVAEEDVVIG